MSREVLAPPLQRMSRNRNYRVNVRHSDFGGDDWRSSRQPPVAENWRASGDSQQQVYVEQDLYENDDYDEGLQSADIDDAIEELPNGGFQLEMLVPNAFHGGLIGAKGATLRRLESESRAQIIVPDRNDNSAKVLLKGRSRGNVCAAHQKISVLIKSLRARMRPTHFLGVPLNSGAVRVRYEEFKRQVLDANLPGIDATLFQSEKYIHLTLGVCVLLDDSERSKAVEVLESCRKYVPNGASSFVIKVKGLEIMNDDPSAVRVLYAVIEAPELQEFADACMKPFAESGLAATEGFTREHVKLHMTLLNNRYRSEQIANAPKNFDAREILERFGDFEFGTIECNEVHLCVLNSGNKKIDEFYKTTGTLKL